MGRFINLNNTHIIDITEIQSIEFEAKEIGTLYNSDKLAERYTRMTGKEVSDYPGTKLKGIYDQIKIELKSGHLIRVEEFDLKNLKNYLLSLLESVVYFECANIKYIKPNSSSVFIEGEIEVKARLETGDYPLDLALKDCERIDVRIEK